jgi:hypothetical protein
MLAAALLALAACSNRDVPPTQGAERPDWLPIQPEHYERYPVPESWRENLAQRLRSLAAPPA